MFFAVILNAVKDPCLACRRRCLTKSPNRRDRGAEISHLSFKDIMMEDVHTSILISEYSPKVMPDGPFAAAPVGRLTPHFHKVRIENVRSTGGDQAGVIVGLPESPEVDIVLKHVSIEAKKGLQVGYATVRFDGVEVIAEDGRPLEKGPEASRNHRGPSTPLRSAQDDGG